MHLKMMRRTNMSKISEQKALEEYPVVEFFNENGMLEDAYRDIRIGYEEGYDQAMQDFLEKAERSFLILFDSPIDKFEQFKNYMQDEM